MVGKHLVLQHIDVGDGGVGGAIAPPGHFQQGKTHLNRANLGKKVHEKVTQVLPRALPRECDSVIEAMSNPVVPQTKPLFCFHKQPKQSGQIVNSRCLNLCAKTSYFFIPIWF